MAVSEYVITDDSILDKMCFKVRNASEISLVDFLIGLTGLTRDTVIKNIHAFSFKNKYLGDLITEKNNKHYYVSCFGAWAFATTYQITKAYGKYPKLNYFLSNDEHIIYTHFMAKPNFFKDLAMDSISFLYNDSVYRICFRLFFMLLINKYGVNHPHVIKNVAYTLIGASGWSYVYLVQTIINLISRYSRICEVPDAQLYHINSLNVNDIRAVSNVIHNIVETMAFVAPQFGTCSICYKGDVELVGPQQLYFFDTECRCLGTDKLMCTECTNNVIGTSGTCPFCRSDLRMWYDLYTLSS